MLTKLGLAGLLLVLLPGPGSSAWTAAQDSGGDLTHDGFDRCCHFPLPSTYYVRSFGGFQDARFDESYFLSSPVGDLSINLNIDPSRVCLTGFSCAPPDV